MNSPSVQVFCEYATGTQFYNGSRTTSEIPAKPLVSSRIIWRRHEKSSATTGELKSSENEVKTLGLLHVSPNGVGAGKFKRLSALAPVVGLKPPN